MKFPYGISDFHRLITGGYFYVDRTDRIRLIEDAGPQLLFLRPRRFGKSLLLSMLENYYDVANADEFDTLFGDLAIGQAPTSLRSQYLIMRWDFSVVQTHRDIAAIEMSLHNHLNNRIRFFADRYQAWLAHPIDIKPTDSIASFESALSVVRQSPHRLYLLIDEYDNFANEVVMSGRTASRARYEELLQGEGLFKTLFKAIKAGSTGLGLERVFITGVSPIVLSDATSGYNIAENVSLLPAFNDVCGFWETEVTGALEQVVSECGLPPEKGAEALHMMRTFYNGYAFSEDSAELIYNPTLVLYFLKQLQWRSRAPRNMLDGNFAMDRAKIAYVARLVGGQRLILDAIQEEGQVAVPQLDDRFGLAEMLAATHDTGFMASLLYYLGVLTLGGQTRSGQLALTIPNLVVRRLYVDRLRDMLLPDGPTRDEGRWAAEALYQSGDPQPLCDFMEQRYFKVFDNRDYRWANEMTIKTAFLTLLFNDTFYIVDSKTALERTYADLTMIVRPEMRQYQLLDILLEFKYVKLSDVELSGGEARQLTADELKALPHIQRQLAEAQMQLRNHRAALEAKYGESMRLHTYAVVALGFDRLVWQEV